MLSLSKTIKFSVLDITDPKNNEQKASIVSKKQDKRVDLDDIIVENNNDLFHAFSCCLSSHGTVILKSICPLAVVDDTKRMLQPLVTTLKRTYDHITDEFMENHGTLLPVILSPSSLLTLISVSCSPSTLFTLISASQPSSIQTTICFCYYYRGLGCFTYCTIAPYWSRQTQCPFRSL